MIVGGDKQSIYLLHHLDWKSGTPFLLLFFKSLFFDFRERKERRKRKTSICFTYVRIHWWNGFLKIKVFLFYLYIKNVMCFQIVLIL